MLKGIDISHHNKNMKRISDINQFDFVIMKATEGVTYKDPALSTYMNYLNKDTLRGFYHYARPENRNSARAEALHFLSTILKYMNASPCILALDVEGGALSYKDLDKWVHDWCKYIYDAVGIKPLIYTSEYECHRFQMAADLGCGLWVAKWGLIYPSKRKIKPFPFWAIWQKSSKEIVSGIRCDLNVFNGSREQFLKYCERR